MATLREWLRRVWGTISRTRRDRELEEELRMHLALAEEDAGQRGSTPASAARSARLEAGGVSQAMDALRDQRGLPIVDALARDVRFGARMLVKDHWVTLAAVLALALGIAANNTVFTIVHAILLRDLPFDHPDRIVAIGTRVGSVRTVNTGISYPDFQDWQTAAHAFDALGAARETTMNVSDDRVTPERFVGSDISANAFSLLGQRPILGRDFFPDDDRIGALLLLAGSGRAGAGRAGAGAAGRGAAGADAQSDEGGRGARQPERKDRLYQWLSPFDDASRKVLFESTTRMTGLRFSPDAKLIFFSERAGQNSVDYAVDLAAPAQRYTLARYRFDDVYANPGSIVGVRGGGGGGGRGAGGGRGGGGGGGGPVLLSADGSSVFFQGSVYDRNPNEVGPKSFIDKVAIKSGEKQRVYESENRDVYERVSSVLDADAGRFIVAREGPKTVPQHYLVQGTARTQLTQNQDYTPDVTNAVVERLTIERPDGFKFRTTVTLPQGYQKGTRLPAIFWFYPREFADQDAYDRPDRTYNKNSFQAFGLRSMEFFVRLGYAVVEPDSPIVGPAGQMNNNYVHDLRNNLAAVIDELDRRALVDRTRLAIGGHSYGAFSAVNAMVHTPYFKAGIAGDGAYNRTLTPIGFQSERRDLWEAPNVYLSMSPFLYANNLSGALLMYHGLADQNVGTDPTNSVRLYHALNGLGKTSALYLYPLEDHGPASKETLLDLWARWAAWLDKYVKNPSKAEPKKVTTTEQASR